MFKVIGKRLGVNWNWESNPQYLAQVGHSLGGYGIVFTIAAFFGHTTMWWAYAGVIVIAGLKEFLWDVAPPPYGEGDSWSDSFMDWCFWVLGATVGMGMFWLAVSHHAAFN